MKILCLSDLHMNTNKPTEYMQTISKVKQIISETNPDIVVITGDIVYPITKIQVVINYIFGTSIPIIVTLGNHEFWEYHWKFTLHLAKTTCSYSKNIFLLDMLGKVNIGGVNFVGGALFFDGSMRWKEDQKLRPFNGWNDDLIEGIDNEYLNINKYYTDMIKANVVQGSSTILCTHHVPHEKLNIHDSSPYSFYTGMKDFISEIHFDARYDNYIICGHTHRRIIGEVIPNFMCVNVGSDYNNINYYVLDI